MTSSSRVFLLPHSRNDSFVGRDDLLSELHRSLTTHSTTDGQAVLAAFGPGGIGKTSLLTEYAHRHRATYPVVAFLRASDPGQLDLDLTTLATALSLPASDSPDALRSAILQHLASLPAYLLIFDAVESPQDIAPFLPTAPSSPTHQHHILISTRSADVADLYDGFRLPPLARQYSIALLRSRWTSLPVAPTPAEADQLAKALEDLPLALDIAASCIEQARLTVPDYLSHLEATWATHLKHPPQATDIYPAALVLALEVSIQRVNELYTSAANLLRLSSYLAVDDIPLDLLRHTASTLEFPLSQLAADSLRMDRALDALRRYALVEVHPRSFTLHPLVAQIVRDRLDPSGQTFYSAQTVRLSAEAFNFDSANVATWSRCAPVLPHALISCSHAGRLRVEPSITCRLMNDAGRYLHKRAQHRAALPVLHTALQLHESLYGPTHPKVSGVLNNLARVLTDLDRLAEAQLYLKRALDLDESIYGSDDPHVATVLTNYGSCLLATGDTDTALRQFTFARDIFQRVYGEGHPRTAVANNNIAYTLRRLGQHAQAATLFQSALTAAEAALGPNHPSVATICHNLAACLHHDGNTPAAKQLLERAAAIDQAAYGQNHPDVARDLDKLADLLAATGDHAAARDHLTKALAIVRNFYGDQHPRTERLRTRLQYTLPA
jgi:tetratricopeptide (TPR) repeat protein